MTDRWLSRVREIREQLELAYDRNAENAAYQRDLHSYERPGRRPETVIESPLLCEPGYWERTKTAIEALEDALFERLRRMP